MCPIGSSNPQAISKILNLPDYIYSDLIVAVGYPAESAEAPDRPKLEEVIFHEQYGRKEI